LPVATLTPRGAGAKRTWRNHPFPGSPGDKGVADEQGRGDGAIPETPRPPRASCDRRRSLPKACFVPGENYRASSWTWRSVADAKRSATANIPGGVMSCGHPPRQLSTMAV